MIVAVHQPTFLPWLGWWDKLARADVMVLLDDAQVPRESRGTWLNRVKLMVSGEPRWVTMPIVRADGVRAVNETRIDETQPWRRRVLGSIEQSYRRAPYFDAVMPVVREAIEQRAESVAEFNEQAIRRLAALMDLPGERLVRASQLGVGSAATQRLIDLTKAVGGDVYLSGDGADGYMDPGEFAGTGVELRLQGFTDPSPVPGLSVVDHLMREGPAA